MESGNEHAAPVANDLEIVEATPTVERVTVKPKGEFMSPDRASTPDSSHGIRHGVVEFFASPGEDKDAQAEGQAAGADGDDQPPIQVTTEQLEARKRRFSFLRSKRFWIVLVLSQCLSLGDTGTNTITTLLFQAGTSIPAFQNVFNYVLLALVYGSYTIYKYGFKGWLRLNYKDGWKYFFLAFCDVQGNYFTVLAYRYTDLLSAQLINFWAIAVVVLVSLIFLKVRYHIFQYVGILICCGGLGLLIGSDSIQGTLGGRGPSPVKGDLFALVGATGYGLSNVLEEYFVSKRPIYEVLGQLGFWGVWINGVQAAIFNRHDFQTATWDGKVAALLVGYTLILSWFYSTAPIVFRMASAAFFNIGLLTGNFWGVIVGIQVFHYKVQYLYPVAFVLIIGGHFVYYGTEGILGESKKPWLGENQEGGDNGLGTARRQLQRPDTLV